MSQAVPFDTADGNLVVEGQLGQGGVHENPSRRKLSLSLIYNIEQDIINFLNAD